MSTRSLILRGVGVSRNCGEGRVLYRATCRREERKKSWVIETFIVSFKSLRQKSSAAVSVTPSGRLLNSCSEKLQFFSKFRHFKGGLSHYVLSAENGA